MKIRPNSQSLVLAGESAEEDRRFERALRVNGTPPAQPAKKGCSRRGQELYRIVTQGERRIEVGTIDLVE